MPSSLFTMLRVFGSKSYPVSYTSKKHILMK